MLQCDVAIVGGSCAGAAAGYLLAKAGRQVIVIDKAVFPRNKLCGGMITEKTIKLLMGIYDNIQFDHIIDSSYSTYGIYHSKIGKICKYTNPSRKLFFVERTVFDNYFLIKAEQIGCTVIPGQKVIDIKGNRLISDRGEEISAKYILGADGSHSIVHRLLFEEKNTKEAAIALEVNVAYEHLNCFDDGDGIFPKIYFGAVSDGYGWIFPKRDFATIGLGGLVSTNRDIRNRFNIFLKSIVKDGIDLISSSMRGFPIPFNNLVRKPAKDSVFLLGDAAGLIEPVTGEGIFFAILSGKLAAESILNGDNCDSYYIKRIDKSILKLLNQAYDAKHFLYTPKYLSYAMFKMKNNAKYCKHYFDLLSGEINYVQYGKRVLEDRGKYKSE
jgi:geranylgeranyl reductase family protein